MKKILNKLWKKFRRIGLVRACRYWREKRAANDDRIEAIQDVVDVTATCLDLKLELQLLRAPVDVIEKNVRQEIKKEQAKAKQTALTALLDMHTMTDEQLYEAIKLGVFGEGECWEVAERICQYGGCYISYGEQFKTMRLALESAFIRTIFGAELKTGGLCGDCYTEYMESII